MFVVLQKEDHLSRNRFETAVRKIFRARNWMVKTNNTREKQYFRYYYPKWKVGIAIESNKKEAFRFLRCTKGSAIDPVPGWRGEEGGYPWQGSGLPVEREAAHNSVDAINLTRGGPCFPRPTLGNKEDRPGGVRAKGGARSACIRAFRERSRSKRPSFNLLGDAWLIYKGKRNPWSVLSSLPRYSAGKRTRDAGAWISQMRAILLTKVTVATLE